LSHRRSRRSARSKRGAPIASEIHQQKKRPTNGLRHRKASRVKPAKVRSANRVRAGPRPGVSGYFVRRLWTSRSPMPDAPGAGPDWASTKSPRSGERATWSGGPHTVGKPGDCISARHALSEPTHGPDAPANFLSRLTPQMSGSGLGGPDRSIERTLTMVQNRHKRCRTEGLTERARHWHYASIGRFFGFHQSGVTRHGYSER
jgi:hypothetical protein